MRETYIEEKEPTWPPTQRLKWSTYRPRSTSRKGELKEKALHYSLWKRAPLLTLEFVWEWAWASSLELRRERTSSKSLQGMNCFIRHRKLTLVSKEHQQKTCSTNKENTHTLVEIKELIKLDKTPFLHGQFEDKAQDVNMSRLWGYMRMTG